MGTRGEIFTKPVKVRNRTYFFNVKENTKGDVFLQVVESKDSEGTGFERHSIVVFEDELQEFLIGLDESLGFIEENRKVRAKARFEKLQESRKRDNSLRLKGKVGPEQTTAPYSQKDVSQVCDSRTSKNADNSEENRASLFKKKSRKVVKTHPKDKKR